MTYSFLFFNISKATTTALIQSEHATSVEDILVIYWSKSQVTTPKLQTVSILLKQFPCDDKWLFVWDEPNSIKAKSSLLSLNN